MSTTKLGILAVIIAVAIVVVALRRDATDAVPPPDRAGAQGSPSTLAASLDTGARGEDDIDNDEPPTPPPGVSSGGPFREPTHLQPPEIESLVLQFIARQPGLKAVSISVSCDDAQCEIALTGRGEYGEVFNKLFEESRPDFRVPLASMGTRDIAPGSGQHVIGFEYQPYEDLSDDPDIAARQQAACAAAWHRLTENPTPDDVVRSYLEQEEQRLALAAAVLGRAEAERVEAERLAIRGGPLHRECQL